MPRKWTSREGAPRDSSRHFVPMMVVAVLILCGVVFLFVLAVRYKTRADLADEEDRYRRSFQTYLDDAETSLQVAHALLLTPYDDAIVQARNRVRTSKGFLDQIILKAPKYAPAYRLRGRMLVFLREFDDADADFDAYERLAGGRDRFVDFDRSQGSALRILREATLEPPLEILLARGAKSAEELRRYLDWVKDSTLLRITDAFDLCKIMHAKALYDLFSGDVLSAIEGIDAASSFRPEDGSLPALLALCFLHHPLPEGLERPAIDRAREAIEDGLRMAPHVPELWGLRGVLDLRAGRAGAAAEAFERAVRLDPSYYQALAGLGRALHAMGRLAEAVETLSDAHEAEKALGPSRSWKLRMDRGLAYYALHRSASGSAEERAARLTDALNDLAAAAEIDPSAAEVYIERARIYADQGTVERALQELERCLNLRADHVEARALRTELRIAQGNREGALQDVARLESVYQERGLKPPARIGELRRAAEALPQK
jgi:tetratricopeptide (TPR) repeat protein